jgi:tRNA (cmo5U34)-methyltransferase
MMWARYGEYLRSLGGEEYRGKVFTYIEKEDSPRSVTYQMNLLQKVGFTHVEILHKNSCFAAFGAVKAVEHEKE